MAPAPVHVSTSEVQIPALGDNLEGVARWLGLDLQKSSNGFVCRCPLHADTNPSLNLYKDGHAYCFSCGKSARAEHLLLYVLRARGYRITFSDIMLQLYGGEKSLLQVALETTKTNGEPLTLLQELYVKVNARLRALRGVVPAEKWDGWARVADTALQDGNRVGLCLVLEECRE